MSRSAARRAFSLLELLVVIAIIAVLAGLLLGSLGATRDRARRAQTRATLAQLRGGIELTGVEHGGIPSPSPHPVARTREPRLAFVRAADATLVTPGAAVAPAGEALTVGDLAAIAGGERARVLLPDDRFQGTVGACEIPFAYGVPRRHLTILGSGAGIVRHRHLPAATTWNATAGVLRTPYDGTATATLGGVTRTLYPDAQCLLDGGDIALLEDQSRGIVERALGSAALKDVVARGALHAARDGDGAAMLDGLLVAVGDPSTQFRPGMARLPDGTWSAYRLRGTAIYDAWGGEILFALHRNGKGFALLSAGRDRVLRWDPGADGAFDTPAGADAHAGNDRDGRPDNITDGAE